MPQQQFASVPSPLACPSASQTNASCQPLTDRRPSTNMPRVLDTFLMPGGLCKGGLICACCTTAQLGGGGLHGGGRCVHKKKESHETRDVLGPACVCPPACVMDGWGGRWMGRIGPPCLVPGSCWLQALRPPLPGWDGMKDGLALGTCLGVMGRWCCWFRGGARGVVRSWGLSFFLSVESRVLTVAAPRDGCTQEEKGTFKD